MEIELMKWFQNLFKGGYGFFDPLFEFVSFFGTESFIIILVAVIYWSIDKKTGQFLALSGLGGALINGAIKDLVARPRPFVSGDARVVTSAQQEVLHSYSFPSGHSQNASTLFLGLWLYFKKKWMLIISLMMIMLIGISRVYLGVHYPSDVLIGGIIGIGIVLILHYFFEKYYQYRNYIYATLALGGIFTFLFITSKDSYSALGALLGVLLGFSLEEKYVKFSTKTTKVNKTIRVVVGLVVVLALKMGLSSISLFDVNYWACIRYFILTLFGIFVYPWIFAKKFDKKGR